MVGVCLVGATGSIGRSTLEVVRALRPGVRLRSVFCGGRGGELAAIAREFGVEAAGVADEKSLKKLRDGDPGCATGCGEDFLGEAVAAADLVVSAATGAAGLPASLLAVRHGKRLALANKESLVMAGPLLLAEAKRTGAVILPVDSEHSAILQALRAGRRDEVRRIVLTASGGPFRGRSAEELASVTPEQALDHPTWSMGPRITVDSATLMNKSLEFIEAHWLFGLPPEQIGICVHPQSIVHGMVEFVDGSVVAQMGPPDMRVPIQVALTWPRRSGPAFAGFSVERFARLTFEEPDAERFPAVRFGERAVRLGGTAGAVLNAANEIAVDRFLRGELPFPAIAGVVGTVLEGASLVAEPDLEDIRAADAAAREEASLCRT